MQTVLRKALVGLALLTLAACGAQSGAAPSQGTIVTFRVADTEEYRIRLTDPADIAAVRAMAAGEEGPRIPNGVVVRGEADVNTGYSWHIDPASVEFVDMTAEVCDGRPSDVEQQIITSDRFCPWSAQVVAIDGEPVVAAAAPAPAEQVILTARQEGGIAGIDETLTIYSTGRMELRRAGSSNRAGQLTPEQLVTLQGQLSALVVSPIDGSYPASGADMITTTLDVPVTADEAWVFTTADGAEMPLALRAVLDTLASLRGALA
jgi:hypothetical protein